MAMMMMVFPAIRNISSAGTHRCPKRLVPGVLVRILLAVIHLLLKRLGLFLIAERQSGKAVLELKSMEKDAILIVREGVVDFLVPYDTAICGLFGVSLACLPSKRDTHRYVHKLNP
jgi:hypothetical protein